MVNSNKIDHLHRLLFVQSASQLPKIDALVAATASRPYNHVLAPCTLEDTMFVLARGNHATWLNMLLSDIVLCTWFVVPFLSPLVHIWPPLLRLSLLHALATILSTHRPA